MQKEEKVHVLKMLEGMEEANNGQEIRKFYTIACGLKAVSNQEHPYVKTRIITSSEVTDC